MKTLSSTLDPTRWAAGQFTRPTVHSFKLCIGSAMYRCTLRCKPELGFSRFLTFDFEARLYRVGWLPKARFYRSRQPAY
jgi:hypothetical protein